MANYLNNKDLLREIHKSKFTYCWINNKEKHYFYDAIIFDKDEITEELIETSLQIRADRNAVQAFDKEIFNFQLSGKKGDKPKLNNFKYDGTLKHKETELVFRLMSFDHIPLEEGRKNKPKTQADHHAKVNFPPFKHVSAKGREIARSHWKGDRKTGTFRVDHGYLTDHLAKMFIKLCDRYSTRANWRGYTYVDEMRSQALLQLSQIALQFDESKSQNPFAYYTAAVTNSFTRILNIEKRNQNIRDDLLEKAGHNPSYTRQMKHTIEAGERSEAEYQEKKQLEKQIEEQY